MTRPLTGPGRLVAGRYRLKSQIGGGGMGTVWLARDELLGRQVAVKQILSPAGADQRQIDEQRQRAMREGRIAARLSHPHAISVYDVALENDQPWLVMEHLPSRSLAAVLAEDGVLAADVVAQIGAQVADALAATHAAGIVHRDVKPANILIGRGGRVEGLVKITDFGISHASGDVTLTQTGQITGTPAFLAPEVAQGREMTASADVFSLGATLYTCLEGSPPFGMEDNALAMLHRVAGGAIRPAVRAGSLAAPLRRMLAVEPAERPTMADVRDELATLAAGRDGDTTTVLLARTDLRSATGRDPTATLAPTPATGGTPTPSPPSPEAGTPPPPPLPPPPTGHGPGPAAAGAAGTAAPPDPAAARRESAAAGPAPRRRRRAAVAAAVVVALVLAGLLALWTVGLDEPDAPDPAAREPSPSSAAATSEQETTPEETTPEETTPEETEASSAPTQPAEEPAPPPADTDEDEREAPVEEDPLSADNIEAFLEDYHELVLRDPRAAYARTGPTLRSFISEDNYVAYWRQFSDVDVTDLDVADGRPTATGTLEWVYEDGRTETGRRQFTMIVRDGRLVLDSDFAA